MSLKDTYRKLLGLNNSIENISNFTIFYGSLSISSNLLTSNNSILNSATTVGTNINVLGYSNINNNVSINSNLLINNNNYINNNLYINSNLFVSQKSYFNNASLNSNLYVSKNSLLNNLNVNSLYVSNSTILQNFTINSDLNIYNFTNNNIISINSNLYNSNFTNFYNNLTILSNLYVSNNTILNSNTTFNSNLYINDSSIINNNYTILSNLYVSNISTIENTYIQNNMTILNNLYINGSSLIQNINTSQLIINQLPEYSSNIDAANAGIPLWGFYRTGGILKIRVDRIAPIISISGTNVISVIKGQQYTDPGITVDDNLDNNLIPYISNIAYNSNNYFTGNIPITGSTLITSVNTLLVGYHTITYSAYDSYMNLNKNYRVINVILNNTSPSITLNGSNLTILALNSTYTELGVTISYNITENIIPTILGTVNTSLSGKYLLTYSATDLSGNTSNTLNRTVYVLNTSVYDSYNFNSPSNTYLYLLKNFNLISTSQFWTIESWIYLTAYSSSAYYVVCDFRSLPWTTNNGAFALIISNSGMMGYLYGSSVTTVYSTVVIPLNKWTHIVYQRNGIYMEFYINGLYSGNISLNSTLNQNNIYNLNQITLGHSTDINISSNTYQLLGNLSHFKVSTGIKYNIGFNPNNDLSLDLNNTLFFLNQDYIDIISNTTLTYPILPVKSSRSGYNTLPSTNIETRNLIFNLQVSNLPSTNTIWIDNTNNYQFIVNTTANNFNSLSKVQNNNGWKRTGNISWIMNTTSYNNFKNINWSNGFTLEQWIYIDYDFVPLNTMLLVGMSSMFSTYDFGLCFAPSLFPYTTYLANVLAFSTNGVVNVGSSAININSLKGKWNYFSIVCSVNSTNNTNNILNIYVNGGLIVSLNNTQWTKWPEPFTTNNYFCIGSNSNNGYIASETLNKIHFGNTRMYNRMLFQYEIINNYNNELNNYAIPTSDIYFIKIPNSISSDTITCYDFTNGYLLQSYDFNNLRILDQWCFEIWAYATTWGTNSDSGYLFEFSSGTTYLSFGITSSVANLTSVTYDGNGRPFIFFSGDTTSQWKIKTTPIISLYNWTHLVFQKNSETQLEMYVNGISTGTFTITANDWKYPNFVSSIGLNNLYLGASISNLNSATNHWKGLISQPKINLYRKYTSSFTPSFDLSLNDNGLFLLQDNFINNSIGKPLINNGVIIPSYSTPTLILNGKNPYLAYINIPYDDPGVSLNYYIRDKNININKVGIEQVNTNIVSSYRILYTFIDDRFNLIYTTRQVNVVTNLIPPVITLNGSANVYLKLRTTYTDPGCVVTSVTGEIITPVISGSFDTNTVGVYTISYTASDSSSNTTTVYRIINVFNPLKLAFKRYDLSNLSTTYTISTTFSSNNIILNTLLYNGSVWLARFYDNRSNVYLFTSTNLINWTSNSYFVNLANPINGRQDQTPSNMFGAFVLNSTFYLLPRWPIPHSHVFALYKSDNGLSWTLCNTTTVNFFTNPSIVVCNSIIILYNGLHGPLINNCIVFYTSIDGINWTQNLIPLTASYYGITNLGNAYIINILYGNGVYMFLISGGNDSYTNNYSIFNINNSYTVTTSDFVNYTKSSIFPLINNTLPTKFYNSLGATFGNGLFIVTNTGGNSLIYSLGIWYYYSSNGINWTLGFIPAISQNNSTLISQYSNIFVNRVDFYLNKFLFYFNVSTYSIQNILFYSYDGILWDIDYNYSLSIPNTFYFIFYSNSYNLQFYNIFNTLIVNVPLTILSQPPQISLNGNNPMYINLNSTYNDPGYVIYTVDGSVLVPTIIGTVNTSIVGVNSILYTVTDQYNYTTSITRTVYVINNEQTLQIVSKIQKPSILSSNVTIDIITFNGTIYLASCLDLTGTGFNGACNPIIISSDLINWSFINYFTNLQDPTRPTYSGASSIPDKIFTYKNSIFVIKNWSTGGNTYLLAKSTDGINWTQCINSNTTFVAIINNASYTFKPLTSLSRFYPTDNLLLYSSGDNFTLPSGYKTISFSYSDDGINWTSTCINHNINTTSTWNMQAIFYGNDKYIFYVQNYISGSSRPCYIFTTSDFITYSSTLVTIGLPISMTPQPQNTYYANGIYLIMPYGSVTTLGYYYSTDAINWSIKSLPIEYDNTFNNYRGWVVANKFIIWLTNNVSSENTVCIYSYDGLTWFRDTNVESNFDLVKGPLHRNVTQYSNFVVSIVSNQNDATSTNRAYPIVIIK